MQAATSLNTVQQCVGQFGYSICQCCLANHSVAIQACTTQYWENKMPVTQMYYLNWKFWMKKIIVLFPSICLSRTSVNGVLIMHRNIFVFFPLLHKCLLTEKSSVFTVCVSLIPRPSHVFQCFRRKIGKAWSIMWCNDDTICDAVWKFLPTRPRNRLHVRTLQLASQPAKYIYTVGTRCRRWRGKVGGDFQTAAFHVHTAKLSFNQKRVVIIDN